MLQVPDSNWPGTFPPPGSGSLCSVINLDKRMGVVPNTGSCSMSWCGLKIKLFPSLDNRTVKEKVCDVIYLVVDPHKDPALPSFDSGL